SGGAAAAVSANMALGALGSDTGGSIRQPAAFCGVVGVKPTYGAVSRSGLIAMASSLDQIGPLAKTVEDAELIFNVIKGKDPKDATTVEPPEMIGGGERARKIGIPKECFSLADGGKEGLEKEIANAMARSVSMLKEKGFEVEEVSLPHVDYALAAYYIIMPAEVSANLSRFDGMRYGLREDGKNLLEVYERTRGRGFGLEPRRRIVLGSYVLSAGYYEAYYARAQKVRHLIREDFRRVFNSGVDALLMPTTPHLPWKLGEKVSDPLSMYLEDIFTVPINLAGTPALSVPVGMAEKDGAKLPVGLQLVAPHFFESRLFEIGKILEGSKK
ncbi:MAG: amidase family protein, partial [Patescibacteria group bacterium]